MAMVASSLEEQLATTARQRQWHGSRRAHQQPTVFPDSRLRASACNSGEKRRCWRYFSALATAGLPGVLSVKKFSKRSSDPGAYTLFLPT
eukprot:1482483-Pleurochrysis_carterae.AAC.2